MGNALLTAENISIRYGTRTVLEPCHVTLEPGEVLGIYGPNGAGKSTLLNAWAGLLPLNSGRIMFQGRVLGKDISLLEYHRQTAAVFQDPLLLRGTVWHNATLGLRLRGIGANEQARRVQPWLERLKVAHLAERPVGTLSAGEAQRTSLVRALVLNPLVLFLDEPFAALDAPTRFRLVGELADILAEARIATLFVTHDLPEASELCHRCLVLDQGRVLQEGRLADIAHRPHSRRVAEITGTENIFEATVAESSTDGVWLDWQGLRLRSSGISPVGSSVTLTIRQESAAIQIDSEAKRDNQNVLSGQVTQVRERGPGRLVTVRVGNPHTLQVACSSEPALTTGQRVTVMVPPHEVWIVPE